MPDKVLVLDQSLDSTGFVLLEGNSAILSGAWPLCEGAKNRALGFRELWGKIDAMHKGHGIAKIVHEAPVFGAPNKGHNEIVGAIGLVGVIELFSVSRGLPKPSAYSPRSWRTTFFTKQERKAMSAKPKKVRDWKYAAIQRARQYGHDPATHDEAEAIGIADHWLLKCEIMPKWREEASGMLDPIA